MDKLPVFEAFIGDEQDGVLVMSLVESPATEFNWLMFSKERETVKFSFDEEQRILKGVVMLADTPIYRRNGDYEYYIMYSKETLKAMAQKMLNDHTFNTLDTEHSHNMLGNGDAELRELFIKDVENGINPKGFEEVPDGSLLCTYYIANDDIWERAKNGEFKGFSLEGIFSVKEAETYNKQNNKKEKKMSKINQLKTLLMEIICEFSTVTTVDGKELEVASDEIVEGIAIKADDGEYKLDDGRVIVVKDGVIVEVNEEVAEDEPKEEEKKEDELEVTEEDIVEEEPKEEEVIEEPKEEEVVVEEPTEEVVVEEPTEEEKKEFVDLEELKAKIATLSSEYGTLQAQVNELRDMLSEIASKPAVEPIRDSHEREDFDKYGLKEWRNRK